MFDILDLAGRAHPVHWVKLLPSTNTFHLIDAKSWFPSLTAIFKVVRNPHDPVSYLLELQGHEIATKRAPGQSFEIS